MEVVGDERSLRCVLVRCPQTFAKYVSAAFALPPIGPAYVAASIRRAGYQVRIVDAVGEAIDRFTPVDPDGLLLRRGLDDDEIVERIGEADVIGFSLMFSQDWLPTRELIEAVRKHHPDAVLVGGGEHFTAQPAGALADSPLDYVLTGEGDRSVVDLLEHLEGRRPIEEVAGCWYRRGDEIVSTDAAGRILDIDSLPWPAWDLVPVDAYLDGHHMVSVDRGRSMPVNATRGCPFRCTFCSSPQMWTTRYVTRSPDDVVAEIEHYVRTYGIRNVEFVDLTAIVRKSWAKEFCQRVIDSGLDITWQLPSGTRSEALDAEVLELMVRAGCSNLTYAPESGDPRTLERMKKKVDLDRMLVSMRAAVGAGCNVKANLIFGYPGETTWSLLRSFRFLAKLAVAGVHDISIAPLKPYPGSELFAELQAEGVLPDPLDDDYYRSLPLGAENLPLSMEAVPSYSEHLSARRLETLRVLALAWFYVVSWFLHPTRPLRLVRSVITGREESRLDKSVREMIRRIRRSRRRGPAPIPSRINPY